MERDVSTKTLNVGRFPANVFVTQETEIEDYFFTYTTKDGV